MKYFILVFVIFICGWNWNTHMDLVDSVFYSLSEETRDNLDLYSLKEGIITPDRDFEDFRYHSYPLSYNKTRDWLEESAMHYGVDKFESSIAFGIASHYITDSFSSPHNFAGENYYDHLYYESLGNNSYLYVPCKFGDVSDVLVNSLETGKDWESWLENESEEKVWEDVSLAMRSLYIFSSMFFGECYDYETVYEEGEFELSYWRVIFIGLLLGLLCLFVILLIKEFVE